ncbi:MAG: hypothetical protein RR177_03415 [Oscillospiraceae bacterium]
MRIFKLTFPYIIAVIIIVTCTASVSVAQRFLPNYKSSAEEFEKSSVTSLLYINKNEALQIYPWDEYDESKAVSGEALQNKLKFRISDVIGYFRPYALPKNDISFSNLKYLPQNNIYYLKDYSYESSDGIRYRLSVSLNENNIYYFSCDLETDKIVSPDQIADEYDKIGTYVKKYEMMKRDSNPFYDFLENYNLLVNNNYYSKGTEILNGDKFFSIWDYKYTDFTYGNNIYLSFRLKSGDFVMIYSAIENDFIGFSMKPFRR